MAWLGLIVCAALLLVQPAITIHAASDACALFAQSVLPGLYPYMILLLLLLDRLPASAPYPALVALGYKPQEASRMVSKIARPDASSETLIREALRAAL